MPVVQKSELMAKMASIKGAIAKSAAAETRYGPEDLPLIKEGVAQLTSIKFDKYKTGKMTGEYYFMAQAVIVEPESVVDAKGKEIKVAGKHTKIGPMPCCQTTNQKGEVTSIEENVDRVVNELKRLGASAESLSDGDLEGVGAALVEAAPYFKFSVTSRLNQQTKQPDGVWENWNGCRDMENYTPPEAGGAKVEEPTKTKPPTKKTPEPEPEPEPEPQADFDEFGDLDSLATKAEAGDAAAQNTIEELATKKGILDQVQAASSWAEGVELLKGGDENEGAEAEWAPDKGDVYQYKPIDPKTKKPVKNPVEVEVTSVDTDKQQVNVKRLDTKAAVKGISWDALIR